MVLPVLPGTAAEREGEADVEEQGSGGDNELSISNNNGDGQHDADQEALQGPSPFPREKDWERLYVRGGGGDLWIGAGLPPDADGVPPPLDGPGSITAGQRFQVSIAVVTAMILIVVIGKWIQSSLLRREARRGSAAAAVRAETMAEARRALEIAETRALDNYEQKCDQVDDRLCDLRVVTEAASCRAALEETKLATLRQCHRREARELEESLESIRMENDRLAGQVAAERTARSLQRERLRAALEAETRHAREVERHVTMLQDALDKEKARVQDLTAKNAKMATARRDRDIAESTKRTAEFDKRAKAAMPLAVPARSESAPSSQLPTSKNETKEGLWLPSPAKEQSDGFDAATGEGSAVVRGDGKSGVEVEGGHQGEVTVATDSDLKRRFLRNVTRKYGNDDAAGRDRVRLATETQLSRESGSLMRDAVLSQGEFATVSVVIHKLGRFALKEVTPTCSKSRQEDALHEMHLLVSLKFHPNLIGVMAVDDTLPNMPILMEYATMDAFTVLENSHCYSMLQRTSLLRDAAEGLLYMHARGCVHVDVKAENVLLVKQGDSDDVLQAKIADVGLARMCGDIRPKMTGTPGYIPIENITATVDAEFDQDVFSLGVLTLMLLLRPELQGNNVFALAALLTEVEMNEAEKIDEGDEAADIAFDLSVALRTAADGSFERTVLIPENLQEVVPCKDEVCQLLKACLSTDPSLRPTLEDYAVNLDRLVAESRSC